MPISKYNQDGTVDIFNSKTGEVKQGVQPSDLAAISPNLSSEFLANSQDPESSAALRDEFRSASNDLEFGKIKSSFDKIQAATPSAAGDLSLIFSYMKILDPGSTVREGEQATAEQARGVPATILNTYNKVLKGNKLAESQREDFKSQAGILFNTVAERQQKLNDFYSEQARSQGIDPQSVIGVVGEVELADTTVASEPEAETETSLGGKIVQAGKGIKDFFLGSAINLAEDVGAGVALRGEAGQGAFESQQQAIEAARKSTELAQTTEDPEQRARLEKVSGETLERVGADVGEIGALASEDIDKSVAERSIASALEIGAAAEIPSLVKGVAKLPGKISQASRAIKGKGAGLIEKATKALGPKPAKFSPEILEEGLKLASKGRKTRTVAIEAAEAAGKKVPGSKIFNQISAWAKEAKTGATSSEAKQIDDLVKRASRFYKGKSLNPTTVKSRWDVAKKGFSAAGKTGDTVKSGFHRAVREGIRKELDKVAPGFEAGTQAIRKGLEREKTLKSVRLALERSGIKEGLKETPSAVTEALKKLRLPASIVAGTALGRGFLDRGE